MSKNNYVGELSLSTTVVARFLSLCAILLALPAIASAQCISQLTVQRVWTQDVGGNIKTTFAPGETIQFVAELNNSYGGYLLAANGTQLTITTSFYNDTKPVDIPPGISAWPWNATAPSTEGNYTVTVKAYDHFCGTFPEGSASFTVGAERTPNPTIRKPGKFKKQPVYSTEIPQGLAPNLVVLVHGCCTEKEHLNDWHEIRSSIRTRIEQNQSPKAWEIVVWDWTDVTKGKIPGLPGTPGDAYRGGPDHGQRLGNEIIKWQYNYVHFIAHSAGTRLIHEAAKYIKAKDATPPFIHSTFLDAYSPNSDNKIYAYRSDYAEQYVDRGLPLTDADLWDAYNFSITDLPKYPLGTQFPNGWPNDLYLQYHFWPVEWYQQSIQTASVYRFGFPLSFEANGNPDLFSYYSELKNTLLNPIFPGGPGGSCKIESETVCTVEHELGKSMIIAYHNPSEYTVNFIDSEVSPTGTVELYADNGILKTGSPVWFEAPITTTRTFNLIKFDYEFLSAAGSEGIMTVFVDDQLVYKIDERIIDPGVNTAQDIPVGELAPGTHTIGFRLDPFTDVQSVARISNMQLGEVVKKTVEPPRLSPRCQELLVGQNCGTSSISCISLRIPVGATCQGECAESTADSLRAEGIAVLGPSGGLPEGFPPACVGFRPDIGGTAEGAQCLVDFLGPPYQLEDLEEGNCRVDGFPYNVYLE